MCQFCVDLINGLLISVTRFVSPLMQFVERYVSCGVLRGQQSSVKGKNCMYISYFNRNTSICCNNISTVLTIRTLKESPWMPIGSMDCRIHGFISAIASSEDRRTWKYKCRYLTPNLGLRRCRYVKSLQYIQLEPNSIIVAAFPRLDVILLCEYIMTFGYFSYGSGKDSCS